MNSSYNEGGKCYHVKYKEDKNMENNIENALWKDYNDLGDIMKVIGESNEQKSDILDERDRIRQELIKLEQSKNEIRVKREEIDAENKREQVRNRITMITFGVSTGLSLYAIIMTFYFDRDRTITSTLGRNILNSVLPLKLFSKR
jgi:hypothetical protein